MVYISYAIGTCHEKVGSAFSLLAVTSSVTMPIGLDIASPVAEIISISKWFLIPGIGAWLITGIALSFQRVSN